MPVQVIDQQNMGGGEYMVLLEAQTRQELVEPETKTLAVRTAEFSGIAKASVAEPTESPYPVDEDGNTSDDLIMGHKPVAAYRRRFILRRGL